MRFIDPDSFIQGQQSVIYQNKFQIKKMFSHLSRYQKKISRPPHSIWTNPIHFIACGFGLGTFPFFPGTIATLFAILLCLMLSNFSLLFYCVICVLLFVIGIYCCDVTNKDFGTQDHPAAVFDEIATFPVTLIAIPMTWYFILIAFILFRFFDIVKPGPIRWVDQHVHGGLGVMLDDLLAALATLMLLQLLHFFW